MILNKAQCLMSSHRPVLWSQNRLMRATAAASLHLCSSSRSSGGTGYNCCTNTASFQSYLHKGNFCSKKCSCASSQCVYRNVTFDGQTEQSKHISKCKTLHDGELKMVISSSTNSLLSDITGILWQGINLSARDVLWKRHRLKSIGFSSSFSQFCYFHTSQPVLGTKKKKLAPLPLKNKVKRDHVDVWKEMTVNDLAAALNKDLESLYEIFTYVKGFNANVYNRGSLKIGNYDVIDQVVRITGKKASLVKHPDAEVIVKKDKDAYKRPPASEKAKVPRPPVITIMGHVDHGKTTLLDTLRNSRVVDSEFGGITQHIGAFQFALPNGFPITVLDTPGHAAFSSMRNRGANVTDMAVLVVAADDGVMPQTVESIQHANNAGVPIVVAINKIDKVDANVERTRMSLINAGVQLEVQGGEVQSVEISAKLGTNVSQLVEAILLQAELLDLRADPKGMVEATVIEANADSDSVKGKVATCLIQRGTLRVGDVLVAGLAWVKVKALFNEHGEELREAKPATPVQVPGWKDVPNAGDQVLQVESQQRAKEVMKYRRQNEASAKQVDEMAVILEKVKAHNEVYKPLLEEKRLRGIRYRMRLDPSHPSLQKPEQELEPQVSIVLKCDVQGSLEAILQVLETYNSKFVKFNLISFGIGHVTPNDVELAETFKGVIFTFNTDVPAASRDLADESGVSIINTNIIYRLIEQLQQRISEQMPTVPQEEILGEADVLEQFLVTDGKRKKTPVAGCRCVKGVLKRKAQFRIIRDDELIHSGALTSMRHLKSEAETINVDKECGLKFEDTSVKVLPGDRIVCYTINQLPQQCDWHPPGF